MPITDFFRRWFFGANGNESKSDNFEDNKHYRHNFRNPIWHNDDDYDDDDDDFRRPGNGIHFTIDSDPMEIAKFFESEMDSFFKSFMFGTTINPFSFFKEPDFGMEREGLPSIEEDKSSSLRDQVLKPGFKEPVQHEQRVDSDIDGKLNAEQLGKIWGNKHDASQMPLVPFESVEPSPGQRGLMPQIRFGGGHIMKKHVLTDSNGNVRTTCTRQIGGKTHIVTTVRDKNGVETKTESLINMNEDDLEKFNEAWNGARGSRDSSDSQQNWSGFSDGVDWKKYFDPKL